MGVHQIIGVRLFALANTQVDSGLTVNKVAYRQFIGKGVCVVGRNFRLLDNKNSAYADAVSMLSAECLRCGDCRKECSFLDHLDYPGAVAEGYKKDRNFEHSSSFNCSLCGLCTVRCPKDLPVAEMFLELRRKSVDAGEGSFKEHRGLLFFEAVGSSALFSTHLLPKGCDTVFFPGCSLPGIRPLQTLEMFRSLQKKFTTLGIILDCCSKPSHDLGRQRSFKKRFSKLLDKMKSAGIIHVVTACPSCLQIFNQYGEGLTVSFAYSHLEAEKICQGVGEYTIHDPCTTRFDPKIQQTVRSLVAKGGARLKEFKMSGENTLCCGEGGGAGFLEKGAGRSWTQKRREEAGKEAILTYCAGCTSSLGTEKSSHIVDILYPDIPTPGEKVRPPKTYFNRLFLKFKLFFKVF